MQITQCHKKACRGFTLIELVLSIAIIGVLAVSVGPMIMTGGRSYELVAKRKSNLVQAKIAMDRITEEMALISTTDNIVAFGSGSITFNIPAENNIIYTLNGSNLTRKGVDLAENATGLTFTYLDSNGNVTATKANIKRIGVEIVVSPGSGFGTLHLRNQVFPRRFSNAYAGYQ